MSAEPTPPSDDEFVDAYLAYYGGAWREEKSEHDWAADRMRHWLRDDPRRAWTMLCHVVDRASPDLAYFIGCGDVEDFVNAHAAEYIDRIEARTKESGHFLIALASIWPVRELPRDILLRLLAATHGRMSTSGLDLETPPDPP